MDQSGEFGMADLNISIVILEMLMSAGVDAVLQYIFTGDVDIWEVILAGGVGMVGGAAGAAARVSFYLSKSALHAGRWERPFSSFKEFWPYFLKFLGMGTSTSSARMQMLPMWRALASGTGSRILAAGYNLFLASFFSED